MRKHFIFIVLFFNICLSYSRNYTELQEWRGKALPSQIKNGVVVEVYDLKKLENDSIGVNIRLHNLSTKTLDEVVIKLWMWKRDGVWVDEVTLLEKDGSSGSVISGREYFFPRKSSYYAVKGIEYGEITKIQIEISRLVSKRAR